MFLLSSASTNTKFKPSLHRSTLPSYAAQSLTSGRLGNGLGTGLGHGHMSAFSSSTANPVTANLATLRRSSPNSSSQYSQWRIQKDLGGRCSWKFVAIFFVLLSVILISALIYTTGKSSFILGTFFNDVTHSLSHKQKVKLIPVDKDNKKETNKLIFFK